MKKTIVIRAGLAILILASALSWQHFRNESDVNIHQKVCGSWRTTNAKSSFTMIFAPDGTFWFGPAPYNDGFRGTWQVSDGFVFMTTISHDAHGRQSRSISYLRLKINHLDDHQLVCEQNRLDDHQRLVRESEGSEEMSTIMRLSR
jgi:hypothetical protein